MKNTRAIVVLCTALLLQGCAVGQSGEVKNGKDISGTELNVVTPFGEGDGYKGIYGELLQEFSDSSGVIVNDKSERSSEAWKQSVLESFENGTEPDVLFFFTGATVDGLVQDKKIVDLSTIIGYRREYATNINLSVLNTMKASDGQNYCVPVTGFWEGLFVNKDLFEKYNVNIPKNIDELLEVAGVFRANGITPIAVNLATTPHYWFEYLLYNYTGPATHHIIDGSERVSESLNSSMEIFRELYENGAFPENLESIGDVECLAMFNNKEAAMMLDGSWNVASITDRQNVSIAHVPSVDGGARKTTDIICGFSMGYYITQKAWDTKRDASIAFVEAMTGETALARFNANGSASPGRKYEMGDAPPLLSSAGEFIATATAFVPAAQDSFRKEAREYLFPEIINIAEGKSEIREVVGRFLSLNG